MRGRRFTNNNKDNWSMRQNYFEAAAMPDNLMKRTGLG